MDDPGTAGTVDPETLASLPELYHPTVSPDGESVAFYYDGSGRNELYLLDRASGESEQVSAGDVPRDATWPILWGGTGERVYFHRDAAGDEQNDVVAIDREGATETVVDVDGQCILYDTTDDGRYLCYGNDRNGQLNLYRHDTDTGEDRQLTGYDQPASAVGFSPDGERVAYLTNESENLENRDVYVMAPDGSGKRRLDVGTGGSDTRAADWFPDGERLLVSDDTDDLRRVGVYDLDSDTVEWLGDGSVQEGGVAVSPDGRYVLVAAERRAATMPAVYDLSTGERRELDLPEGVAAFSVRGCDRVFADAETIVFAHSSSADTVGQKSVSTCGVPVGPQVLTMFCPIV